MKNTTNWLILALTLTCASLAGCGMEEHGGGDDGCGDETDTPSDVHEDSPAGDGGATSDTPQGDAGSTGSSDTAPTGDAGTGGTGPSADAGTGDTGSSDAGTGGTGTGDAGTGSSDAGAGGAGGDAGTTIPAQPAPLHSPYTCVLRFADTYIGGSACGQVRGNLPGATWSSGQMLYDTNADHDLELTLTVAPAAGTYELTYVSAMCPGGSPVTETWASYGARAQLLGMTEDARSFVSCNWWDAASGMTMSVESPGCNLRVQIDSACNVTGAGNMRNYR